MGRATRWFKGLFGLKGASKDDRERPSGGIGGSARESRFCHNPATIPPNITPAEASWLRSYYPQAKDDGEAARNKHAIAVAAATAAAADAAVAAAQAAAQVVMLTSQGSSLSNSKNNLLVGAGRSHRNWAAVRIQSNFRAHLARKALRALKGLVKIQALVRGYLVRKQATATLHGMQALIRAQATVRSKRTFVGLSQQTDRPDSQAHSEPYSWARPSMDVDGGEQHSNAPSTVARGGRLSASWTLNPPLEQDTPKVVEVDSGQNWPESSRTGPGPNTSFSELGEDPSSYQLLPPHFRKGAAQFAPCRVTHHCCHHSNGAVQTTPRLFSNPSMVEGRPGEGNIHGGWETQRLYYEYPSYMAKTASFKAKVRSQSAPKQRAEGHRKRMSLEGRSSVGMQRSSSHVEQEVVNFRNAVMSRLANSHFSSYN